MRDRYEQIKRKINADDAENLIEWTLKFLFKPKKVVSFYTVGFFLLSQKFLLCDLDQLKIVLQRFKIS